MAKQVKRNVQNHLPRGEACGGMPNIYVYCRERKRLIVKTTIGKDTLTGRGLFGLRRNERHG